MAVTVHELREALDVATIRGLQVMQAGLTGGVLAFAAVVYGKTVLFDVSVPEADASDLALLRTLSLVNGVFTVGAWIVGAMLLRRKLRSVGDSGSAVSRLEAFRGGWILRWALIEGAALFGIAICYIAAERGVLVAHPAYWLNLVPAGLMVVFAAVTFPTRDRLVETLTN